MRVSVGCPRFCGHRACMGLTVEAITEARTKAALALLAKEGVELNDTKASHEEEKEGETEW